MYFNQFLNHLYLKREFGRQYNGLEDESSKRQVFEQNLHLIVNHNINADNGVHTFRLAVNQFADMTNAEFRRVMNGYRSDLRVKRNTTVYTGEAHALLPATVDWRTKGAVTKVKDQGQV